MRRRALLAAPLLATAPTWGDEDPVRVSLLVEAPPEGAFVQEMVRLTLHAVFRDQPNQVAITQPDFVDARWLALGDDAWSRIAVGGPARVLMLRRLAWFPQRSGKLTVGAFRLDAMVLDEKLARVPVSRSTASVSITVRPAPADAGDWWLPARSVRLIDSFSVAPDRLGLDQVARRSVTVEADGVEAPQVPPLPPLHIPGVIAFAQPVQTQTLARPEGPLVRVVYAWDIRPVNANPALLPEIRIPWFDTAARTMREAVLPPVTVSLAAAAPAELSPSPAPTRPPVDVAGMLLAGGSAFVLASAVVWLPWAKLPGWARRLRLLFAIAWRVWRHDAAGLRRLLADEPRLAPVLAVLDRHLFAEPPGPLPPLWTLIRSAARR